MAHLRSLPGALVRDNHLQLVSINSAPEQRRQSLCLAKSGTVIVAGIASLVNGDCHALASAGIGKRILTWGPHSAS
jgi:hypothetical protein